MNLNDEWHPPKCFYDSEESVVKEILNADEFDSCEIEKFMEIDFSLKEPKTRYKSFDCQIMDLADDITNAFHDLEDAIELKLISRHDLYGLLITCVHVRKLFFSKCFCDKNLSCDVRNEIYNKVSSWFEKPVESTVIRKNDIGNAIGQVIKRITVSKAEEKIFDNQLLKYKIKLNDEDKVGIDRLTCFIFDEVINSKKVQSTVYGGQMAVMQLFDAVLSNHNKLLPEKFEKMGAEYNSFERAVADYIAGMTDEYAIKLHKRLYGSTPGSTFDRL